MSKRMHCEEQLRYDIENPDVMAIEHWSYGGYSTSAHLKMMVSIVESMKAERVAEVGCGRSTIALRQGCWKTGGRLYSCDRYDYRWLYPELFVGNTKSFWAQFPADYFQVIFLDHLSSRKYSVHDVDKEIKMAWKHLTDPGVLMIHDAGNLKYNVSMSDWVKRGCILPFGHSMAIIVKGAWSLEKEPWPKRPDTTEVEEWS